MSSSNRILTTGRLPSWIPALVLQSIVAALALSSSVLTEAAAASTQELNRDIGVQADEDAVLGLGLTVFIVICVGVGLVIVGIIACICFCVCRSSRRSKSPPAIISNNVPTQAPGWGGYAQQQPPAEYAIGNNVEPQKNHLANNNAYRNEPGLQRAPSTAGPYSPPPEARVSPPPQQQPYEPHQANQQVQSASNGRDRDPNLIENRFKPVVPPKPKRNDPAWNAVTNEVKNWQSQHPQSFNNYGYAGTPSSIPTSPVSDSGSKTNTNDNFMY